MNFFKQLQLFHAVFRFRIRPDPSRYDHSNPVCKNHPKLWECYIVQNLIFYLFFFIKEKYMRIFQSSRAFLKSSRVEAKTLRKQNLRNFNINRIWIELKTKFPFKFGSGAGSGSGSGFYTNPQIRIRLIMKRIQNTDSMLWDSLFQIDEVLKRNGILDPKSVFLEANEKE